MPVRTSAWMTMVGHDSLGRTIHVCYIIRPRYQHSGQKSWKLLKWLCRYTTAWKTQIGALFTTTILRIFVLHTAFLKRLAHSSLTYLFPYHPGQNHHTHYASPVLLQTRNTCQAHAANSAQLPARLNPVKVNLSCCRSDGEQKI